MQPVAEPYPTTGPLLQIRGLEVSFRNTQVARTVLHGIDLAVPPGQTLGIVGESGSGKSLMSLAVMQLLPAAAIIDAGSIEFHSLSRGMVDVVSLCRGQRDTAKPMRGIRGKEMAMIFQEPMTSLNPVMRCGEQVAESLRLHLGLNRRQARQRVIELFQEVNLPRPDHLYDSYPHQLSGGQKQRVMIAMALACDPALLIADEPTTALDVTVQAQVLELLLQLQQQRGMAMLFITHDLGVVAQVAQQIVVMQHGRVVESGPVGQVLNAPQHSYTQGLLACRPLLGRRVHRLPTVAEYLEHGPVQPQPVTDTDLRHRQQWLQAQPVLLQVEHLHVQYPIRKGVLGRTRGWVRAVDDVSLQIRVGETVGLVGESGCGKTTLGRAILRLTDPTAGRVVFDGHDLTALSQAQLRPLRPQFQVVFQDPYGSLNPRMTIGQALLEPLAVHKLRPTAQARRERVLELLHRVGLPPESTQRYPHEFSGGQRQRICIARALALEPRLVVLDESVSALDVSVQAQVLNLLRDLQQEFGLAYLFISHDLSVVKHLADRLLVMHAGCVVEEGWAEDVYRAPQQPYTQRLIAAIPA